MFSFSLPSHRRMIEIKAAFVVSYFFIYFLEKKKAKKINWNLIWEKVEMSDYLAKFQSEQ